MFFIEFDSWDKLKVSANEKYSKVNTLKDLSFESWR